MTTVLKANPGASAALTTTNLQSLASDTNLLAGWSSAVIDNTSNLSVDEQVTGAIVTGTSPTISTSVLVYAWSVLDDTPTYPDTISGSEGTKTITSANVLNSGAFKLLGVITVDATTNRSYPFAFNIAQAFGGTMPKKWGLFVAHNTGVALKSSGQVVTRIPHQYQNV